MPTIEQRSVKCVAVGDGSVGKTNLFMRYVNNDFKGEYAPTVFEFQNRDVNFYDEKIKLGLWDTAGQEGYHDNLRTLTYQKTDVVLLCFSIDNLTSFENVKTKWYPELVSCSDRCSFKILLVGTKSDLKDDFQVVDALRLNGKMPISREQGVQMANEIRAIGYVECSAKTADGVQAVFDTAMESKLGRPIIKKPKKKICNIS